MGFDNRDIRFDGRFKNVVVTIDVTNFLPLG